MKKLIIAILVATLSISSANSLADGHGGLIAGLFAGVMLDRIIQAHAAHKQVTQSLAAQKQSVLVTPQHQTMTQPQISSYYSH